LKSRVLVLSVGSVPLSIPNPHLPLLKKAFAHLGFSIPIGFRMARVVLLLIGVVGAFLYGILANLFGSGFGDLGIFRI